MGTLLATYDVMTTTLKATVPRLAFAVYCLLTLLAGHGLRSDELECEEALVQLDDCCPELDIIDIECFYYATGGCEGSVERPMISEADAQCIKRLSCEQVQGQGVCERVAAAHAERTDPQNTGSDQPSAEGLCR